MKPLSQLFRYEVNNDKGRYCALKDFTATQEFSPNIFEK